ncbi:MAG: histidine phosphatase family protein [Gaiellaceae bacterium]
MTKLLLVRHGETDWNLGDRFQGHADPPLNETGRAQARELADSLAGRSFAAVYSSPLRRAFETAEIVAAPHGLEAVPVEGLREVDVGSWQGLTRDEIEQRFPDHFRRWLEYREGWEDGETYGQMSSRVVATLVELAERHDGEEALVVTHGGPIRAAFASAHGISHSEARRNGPAVGNCFLAEFGVERGALRQLD